MMIANIYNFFYKLPIFYIINRKCPIRSLLTFSVLDEKFKLV